MKIGIIVFVCFVFERPFVVLVGFPTTVGFPALMESEGEVSGMQSATLLLDATKSYTLNL